MRYVQVDTAFAQYSLANQQEQGKLLRNPGSAGQFIGRFPNRYAAVYNDVLSVQISGKSTTSSILRR